MQKTKQSNKTIDTLEVLGKRADYSFINTLSADPDAPADGIDHSPRQVFSGHYVPLRPIPIQNPLYVAHSKKFFKELGLSDALALSQDFMRMFSGDTSHLSEPFRPLGWATGYALSIYGTEYYQQCPFGTGNGYGDGRAISILEAVIDGKRWEMQLKGGGRTPYCRGADGRAVLRSSVREFLAQEHMHALNISTSRSLTLYTSQIEKVRRPWFREGSYSRDPEVMIEEDVAITTRVAPSFLRVGQIELFARRARKKEHSKALQELEMIVLHLIEREYSDVIDTDLSMAQKVLLLARAFCDRLTSLVADWIRVGYTQGNFNSDNCAAGGFTLDYGPFGFIDLFDPEYQPWTGGGVHFSFLNQPQAAQRNFYTFCTALQVLLDPDAREELQKVRDDFSRVMQEKMVRMWSLKLGLQSFDAVLFNELIELMQESSVDYTLFFRELSSVPNAISALNKSFYGNVQYDPKISKRWSDWLEKWRSLVGVTNEESRQELSQKMKQVNPKYTLRECFLVPAYTEAQKGNYSLIEKLQEVMTDPYAEQSAEVEKIYYRKKPDELFRIAGVSHVSCSS
ncbi:MAG: protein adenylyltransferase SelO family protein [Sulfurimonas sp.]|jgi:uncharacterized protein YdiU (UPF0061 family)|nr:protein adenylyltransferase SelO family protein [Sulfurimonas sp.]